jgi:tetratricopeptide (TPR) repeat protein
MKNKQVFAKIIILLLLFLTSSTKAFAQYPSSAIISYNAGVNYQNNGNYSAAEQKYEQALRICPQMSEARNNLKVLYHNLAQQYYSSAQYEKALAYSQKAIALNSKDTTAYHIIAQSYTKTENYQASIAIYKKILAINPNDKLAQNNLECITLQHPKSIAYNNLSITNHAPEQLYKLIKNKAYTSSDEQVQQLKFILDLIWSNQYGRILLQNLIDNKIPINITQSTNTANATEINKSQTFRLYGVIPIFTIESSASEVNIPLKDIMDFSNQSISEYKRIYDLQIFMHEFGHALVAKKRPNHKNSLDEEMDVSMVGYNIAHKILTGEYLSKEETAVYSKGCLVALLSDDHKKLPIFGNTDRAIIGAGIPMPYPELYSNLPFMYKNLYAEKKVPYVESFEAFLH